MQKSCGNFSKFVLLSSTILLLLLLSAPAALAQTNPHLFLQPVESATGVLTVEIMAENVTDLYGLEVHLKYDPAILEAQDIKADQDGVQVEPGMLLPVDKGFVVANQVDQTEGKITYAVTLLNPAPPANGKGSIARITFKVLQNVPSTIEIERAQLVAFDLKTIPAELTPFTIAVRSQETAVAAPVTTTAAPSVASFPWWIVAVSVIVLGLLTIGGVLVLGNFEWPRRSKTAPQPTDPAASPPRMGSGRPSAFK